MRPDLGQIERVEPVVRGLRLGHDLHLQRPARVLALLDRLEEVVAMEVGIGSRHLVGLLLGEELDALVDLEVVLDPEGLAVGVDPPVGVRGVAVHVPEGARDAAVTHQPEHLVQRLGAERPEVPHVGLVAQAAARIALLGVDEVAELDRVAHEEDRRVVTDHVVVAVLGVELEGEASRVPPGVR